MELEPIELECNLGPDFVTGEINRVPWKAYDIDEADSYIRRLKRKRCLAMARWCKTSAQYERSIEAYKYADFYRRWYWKWSELADKFREAK